MADKDLNRRDFLKRAAALAIGGTVLTATPTILLEAILHFTKEDLPSPTKGLLEWMRKLQYGEISLDEFKNQQSEVLANLTSSPKVSSDLGVITLASGGYIDKNGNPSAIEYNSNSKIRYTDAATFFKNAQIGKKNYYLDVSFFPPDVISHFAPEGVLTESTNFFISDTDHNLHNTDVIMLYDGQRNRADSGDDNEIMYITKKEVYTGDPFSLVNVSYEQYWYPHGKHKNQGSRRIDLDGTGRIIYQESKNNVVSPGSIIEEYDKYKSIITDIFPNQT